MYYPKFKYLLLYRIGLIRARLAGAHLARGDVLVFLDAHCECIVQWLEPLLERIEQSPTSVLVPIIDTIDSKDFEYATSGDKSFQVGGFQWNGHFTWIDIPNRERERQRRDCASSNLDICPTFSPTMAGGLFAISKDYFWEIGSYDEQVVLFLCLVFKCITINKFNFKFFRWMVGAEKI